MPDYPKKLIEVSIPLKEINEACAREKSIRHGHPSTLHLWWARRPLAAARSVLFCQLVDDPSGYVDELVKDKPSKDAVEQELLMEPDGEQDLAPRLNERLIEKERERLHDLVKELVIWENTTNEKVLNKARREIRKSWDRHLQREGKPLDTSMPPVLDPFAGGGAIPLEAQRLGMEAHASDLNPVAVLINKAMIEIPPKFAGMPPVNPEWQSKSKEEKAATTWTGAQGLAEDVRYYGQWMRDEAEKRIGHLYPKYELTTGLLDEREDLREAGYVAGEKLTVIAWLWARTVPSPNPALGGRQVPLMSSFWLSKKKGHEAYIDINLDDGDFGFSLVSGRPSDVVAINAGTKTGKAAFKCVISGAPISMEYIRAAGKGGRMEAIGTAVVCEGKRGRVYLPATSTVDDVKAPKKSHSFLDQEFNHYPRAISVPAYGLTHYRDIFSARQTGYLTSLLEILSELVIKLEGDGVSIEGYEEALSLYLAFAISKTTNIGSTSCSWMTDRGAFRETFARQAIPITWDFAEANLSTRIGGSFASSLEKGAKAIALLPALSGANVQQCDAATRDYSRSPVISSDPPYYDNIGYSDLSDYFYVWLREALRQSFPQETAGILVPKSDELIASQDRHGGKDAAEDFFLEGMSKVAANWVSSANPVFPIAIYYAFKQSEIKEQGLVSTGWAVFLSALIDVGFSLVGTWPMRTEGAGRIRATGSNALASSIVLICRKRPSGADAITKREFIEMLETELPIALRELQHANLSPVDLPQSAIGPGMAIYSRHKEVIKGDGSPMSVTEALQIINHELSGILDGQVSDMDPWTRFACKWFDQHAFTVGTYGDAEVIANATDVSVSGVVDSGILESGKGKVRILRPNELPTDWHPQTDTNLTTWEIVHHLIRLAETGGDGDCARILAALTGAQAAEARQLCYRLFTTCDQNKWSKEAQGYNQLITSWTIYEDLASALPAAQAAPTQGDLL